MKPHAHSKHILLIDQQAYWREISTDALKKADFAVGTLDTYHYSLPGQHGEVEHPDLVVLGCARIRAEEQQLIDEILAQKHHLLVLCTSLTWQTMRTLFLKGVDDILDKPYNPAKLVKIVGQAVENTFSYNKQPVAESNGVV